MKLFSILKLKRTREWFETKEMSQQVLIMAVFSVALVFSGVVLSFFFVGHQADCFYDDSFFAYCLSSFQQKFQGFSSYYGENLRGHLFAGYISLGAFLLSLKTFIIISMKSHVYDSKSYKEHHEKEMRKEGIEGDASKKRLYAPLQQLSDFIYYAIVFSLLAAVFQVSIGLIESVYATFFCLWIVVFATVLLFNCLRLIKQNIDVWLNHQ